MRLEFKAGDKVRLIENVRSRYTKAEILVVDYLILEEIDSSATTGDGYLIGIGYFIYKNGKKRDTRNNVHLADYGTFVCEVEHYISYDIEEIEINLDKLKSKYE